MASGIKNHNSIHKPPAIPIRMEKVLPVIGVIGLCTDLTATGGLYLENFSLKRPDNRNEHPPQNQNQQIERNSQLQVVREAVPARPIDEQVRLVSDG